MQTTPSTQPIALVLGANGRLGAAAVQAFAAAGWAVLAQARRTPAALPRGATHLAIDAGRHRRAGPAAAGARVVVYAVNPLYTQWPTQAMPLFHQGLAVAQRLNATFMLPGNVYNFGAQMPPLLNEHTPQQPTTPKGRIRVDMEAELRALARARPLAQHGDPRRRLLRCRQRQLDGPGDHQVAAPGQAGVPGPAAPHARVGLPARPGARLRGGGVARRRAARVCRPAVSPATRSPAPNCWPPSSVPRRRWVWRRAAVTSSTAACRGPCSSSAAWWCRCGARSPRCLTCGTCRTRSTAPRSRARVGPLPATPLDAAMRDALLALGFASSPPVAVEM